MSERNGKLFRKLAFKTGAPKKALRREWKKYNHRERARVRRAWKRNLRLMEKQTERR